MSARGPISVLGIETASAYWAKPGTGWGGRSLRSITLDRYGARLFKAARSAGFAFVRRYFLGMLGGAVSRAALPSM
ncbi:MAG: hypothetical protein QOG83_930 [Alphaproteobacteria bacterium]|nr:hypothetical protein [Alphaproteobacteria bacterium]